MGFERTALMASLQDLMTQLNSGVQAIRSVATALSNAFPQVSATSTAAPSAGTLTFTSSQASLMLAVTTSSGGTYRVALYPSS